MSCPCPHCCRCPSHSPTTSSCPPAAPSSHRLPPILPIPRHLALAATASICHPHRHHLHSVCGLHPRFLNVCMPSACLACALFVLPIAIFLRPISYGYNLTFAHSLHYLLLYDVHSLATCPSSVLCTTISSCLYMAPPASITSLHCCCLTSACCVCLPLHTAFAHCPYLTHAVSDIQFPSTITSFSTSTTCSQLKFDPSFCLGMFAGFVCIL